MTTQFIVPAGAVEENLIAFPLTVTLDGVEGMSSITFTDSEDNELDYEIRSYTDDVLRAVVKVDLVRLDDNIFTAEW
jgi:hypothetical protein